MTLSTGHKLRARELHPRKLCWDGYARPAFRLQRRRRGRRIHYPIRSAPRAPAPRTRRGSRHPQQAVSTFDLDFYPPAVRGSPGVFLEGQTYFDPIVTTAGPQRCLRLHPSPTTAARESRSRRLDRVTRNTSDSPAIRSRLPARVRRGGTVVTVSGPPWRVRRGPRWAAHGDGITGPTHLPAATCPRSLRNRARRHRHTPTDSERCHGFFPTSSTSRPRSILLLLDQPRLHGVTGASGGNRVSQPPAVIRCGLPP